MQIQNAIKKMINIMHQPRTKPLILGIVSLFVLVLTLLGCSGSSEPPVKYEDYEVLRKDCPSLLSNQQNASISGPLNIRDSTVCISDGDGERCKILLGYEEYGGLDIWMKTGGKNGMEDLPDTYHTFDLVVHGDDGDELTALDMVTTTLEPVNEKEDGIEVCSFRVKTILRSKIVAAENQPGEGIVNLEIPANVRWVDTGIYVNQGQRLLISPGYGGYNLQDDNPNWNANSFGMLGVADMICDNNCVINGENYGVLVAKINEGEPFLATIDYSDFPIPANGELYLTVNDCVDCYEDNSGTFDVVIDLHNVQ
jgi:hypothetical protein